MKMSAVTNMQDTPGHCNIEEISKKKSKSLSLRKTKSVSSESPKKKKKKYIDDSDSDVEDESTGSLTQPSEMRNSKILAVNNKQGMCSSAIYIMFFLFAGMEEVESTKKKLECKFCNSFFLSHPNLSRHKKICSKNPNKVQGNVCPSCERSFPRMYIFKTHLKNCQKSALNSSLFTCSFKKCLKKFRFKVDLYDHYVDAHQKDGLKPPETYYFDSLKKFNDWKATIEDDSYSYFSQQYGKRGKAMYLYCQHDGRVKSHRKTGELNRITNRKNRKGIIKKGSLCLAGMRVYFLSDDKIKVVYRPSHSHACRAKDLKHQPVSGPTNDFIAKQLAWGVPPRKIVLSLRDDSYKRQNRFQNTWHLKRDNLVKVKTITERKRKCQSKLRYSDDDATSLSHKVDSLLEEHYNPVLLFKPWMEKTKIGPEGTENLPDDLFILAIQTEEQLNMMKEGCKTMLMMDDTHGLTQYGFRLLNLLVKDQFNLGYPRGLRLAARGPNPAPRERDGATRPLGYPVMHVISSRIDEATLQFAFKALRDRWPDISINCCITDDDPALINSLNAGLGLSIWHILCIWHIHRTLQANIRNHIKDTDLVQEIYVVMCSMINATTEEEFRKLEAAFKLMYANVSPGFFKYMTETFLPKAKKWAKCFRQNYHGNVDTTMHVESFHNILKTVYLNRKPNKRVDDLLDILLQVEEDYFVRYQNAVMTESLSDEDFDAILKRHDRGIKISNLHVANISANLWHVKSQGTDKDTHYTVVKCLDVCTEVLCVFTCASCDSLCSHMFTCTCGDMFPLCKHIHKVFTSQDLHSKNVSATADLENQEPEFFAPEVQVPSVVSTTSACNGTSGVTPVKTPSKSLTNIRGIIGNLESELDKSPVKRFMLPRIRSTLDALVTECKAVTQSLLLQLKNFCVSRGFKQLNYEQQFEVLSEALNQPSLFPHLIKDEMVCYHFEFLKEKLFAML
ncbi:Zinc finger protein 511 [Frankliniella fusca]|uniref:Zinc finger protein 511 n=1 Tax=Frankliniella fusca TaxID=407009 RepID=A0AAE1HVL9_9NEOP|nr:Zinc finger protein 511 [Frankliniella fusca]